MFDFFKRYDISIYNEIINEVEYNLKNNLCIPAIQSELEKILKKIYFENNLTNDYGESSPSIKQIVTSENTKRFLINNKILIDSDFDLIWDLNNKANEKKHGQRGLLEKESNFNFDDQIKKTFFELLYRVCVNAYFFKYREEPDTVWDENYFYSLLIEKEYWVSKIEEVVDTIIPENIKIKDHEFAFRTDLNRIKIPQGITKIADWAFFACENITSVEMHGVLEIGENAFSACIRLTNITLSNELIKIGPNAFRNCVELKSIFIPPNISEIGYNAFDDCFSLTNVSAPKRLNNFFIKYYPNLKVKYY